MLLLFINDLHMNSKIQTMIILSKKKCFEKNIKSHLIYKYSETGSYIQQITPQKEKLSPSALQLKGKRIFWYLGFFFFF